MNEIDQIREHILAISSEKRAITEQLLDIVDGHQDQLAGVIKKANVVMMLNAEASRALALLLRIKSLLAIKKRTKTLRNGN